MAGEEPEELPERVGVSDAPRPATHHPLGRDATARLYLGRRGRFERHSLASVGCSLVKITGIPWWTGSELRATTSSDIVGSGALPLDDGVPLAQCNFRVGSNTIFYLCNLPPAFITGIEYLPI